MKRTWLQKSNTKEHENASNKGFANMEFHDLKKTNYLHMKFHIKNLIFLLGIVIACKAYSQNVEFTKEAFKDNKKGLKEALKFIEAGNNLYEQGTIYYNQAIDPYLFAYTYNPNNALLNFRIGNCYLFSNHKLKALSYLEKAYKLNPNVDPEIHFLLGRAYHLNMELEKATKEYKTYQQTLDVKTQKDKISDVDKKLRECLTGMELAKNPVRVFIDNIGSEINSKYPDYGPVISADGSILMFTSRRENTTGGGKDELGNEYYEDIYISNKKDREWTPAINIGTPINTEGHDATLGLSADGQKLLVYLDKNMGDIFECQLKGEEWSKPSSIGKTINTDYHESSACYSPDGKTIYFVSEKPGGMGYRDIYKSTIDKKGKWGEPVNLGPVINTSYGEEGVFIHPDGKTLYFSSQGHNTMGGYDIFKSVYENGKWSEPENLGYPINSPDDDVFFVISASGKYGFYASVKNLGYGEKDIYMITFLGPEKLPVLNNEDNLLASLTEPVKETVIAPVVEIKSAQITILKGIITDASTEKPIEATIELIDNQRNEVIASFTANSTTGKYLVALPSGKNYGIAVKAEGYLFHSENFDIPLVAAYQEITKDIQLKRPAVGSKIVLKNIFFDFDKATLRPESTAELERLTKLLNEVPSLKIEISGHTDGKGSADYNQKLSENRAKTVVDYLISKGINKNRLEYKGYGLTQPIATNDTDEGRQMNRRTEFKVLSN